MNLKPNNFDFWIENNLNVLLRGKHGVGKTAMVVQAFEKNNLKYKYFSASTMDPWVDFIGVPKEKTDENGNSYLDLVRPKEFQDDEVEAIFMDEFSRAHKKVRNAVMELIQFKSINGRKFKNLKIVWAAINPEDDDDFNYDVDALDPAQEDRFHVHVEVPYKPDVSWFRNEFGTELANSAVSWWNELPPKVQNHVSPRRLEYALTVYGAKGNLRHVLPGSSNVSKLMRVLTSGPIEDKLVALASRKKLVDARDFIKVENNYRDGLPYIIKSKKLRDFFVPLFGNEKLSNLMATENEVYKLAVDKIENKDTKFTEIAREIVTANQNKKLSKQLTKDLHHILNVTDMSELKVAPQSVVGNTASDDATFKRIIKGLQARPATTTAHRKDLMSDLVGNIPDRGLKKQTALHAIHIIDSVAERSHSYTIASPEIVGAVNNCIHAVCKEDKIIWSEFITQHGALISNFLQKMKDSNREKKIYQPGRYGDSELKVQDEMFANLAITVDVDATIPPPIPTAPTDGCVRTPAGAITGDWNG
jgi:hypothetical protein|tara:strand:+ start:302 stop:1897 length:1596 start_codon:yes stop_codon:yes gene_type:complete